MLHYYNTSRTNSYHWLGITLTYSHIKIGPVTPILHPITHFIRHTDTHAYATTCMPHAHSPTYMHPLPDTPGTDTHTNIYTQLFLVYLSILADKVMLVRHVCMHTHTNAHAHTHSQMQTHVHTDSSKLECHTHTCTHVPPTHHTYIHGMDRACHPHTHWARHHNCAFQTGGTTRQRYWSTWKKSSAVCVRLSMWNVVCECVWCGVRVHVCVCAHVVHVCVWVCPYCVWVVGCVSVGTCMLMWEVLCMYVSTCVWVMRGTGFVQDGECRVSMCVHVYGVWCMHACRSVCTCMYACPHLYVWIHPCTHTCQHGTHTWAPLYILWVCAIERGVAVCV